MAKRINNNFERTHGFHITDFAKSESVTDEAIRMRIRNFGSIYQRRKTPTKYEKMYGRTWYEIAEERKLHPQTIETHQTKYGDAYYHNPDWHLTKTVFEDVPRWRQAVQEGEYWNKQSPLYHPKHPDYDAYRAGELYPDDYIGGSKLTPAEVEQMMREAGWEKY